MLIDEIFAPAHIHHHSEKKKEKKSYRILIEHEL